MAMIYETKVDIFNISKNVTFNKKVYSITYSTAYEGRRTIKINGNHTSIGVSESDVENQTPKMKEQLKTAINQYELSMKQSKDYIDWDGNLD